MIHQPIPTHWIIPMGADRLPFDSHRAHAELRDEGSGMYLALRFCNDEPQAGENVNEGYFNSIAEIDQFAAHLNAIWAASDYEVNE